MAGIARPLVHRSRKQSTKVLRELLQMTEKLHIGTVRLSALPLAVTINAWVSSHPWNRLWLCVHRKFVICDKKKCRNPTFKWITAWHTTAVLLMNKNWMPYHGACPYVYYSNIINHGCIALLHNTSDLNNAFCAPLNGHGLLCMCIGIVLMGCPFN